MDGQRWGILLSGERLRLITQQELDQGLEHQILKLDMPWGVVRVSKSAQTYLRHRDEGDPEPYASLAGLLLATLAEAVAWSTAEEGGGEP